MLKEICDEKPELKAAYERLTDEQKANAEYGKRRTRKKNIHRIYKKNIHRIYKWLNREAGNV